MNKITACMIAFNEEEFIGHALKNILECSEYINQLIIVEGCVKDLIEFSKENGGSSDKTVEIIKDFINKYNKDLDIKFVQGLWNNKEQMRNEYLKYVNNDYILLWDADEFYLKEDIEKLVNLIKEYPKIKCIMYPFITFYYDLKHIAKSKNWDKTQLRFSTYEKNYQGYLKHYTLYDEEGKSLQWDLKYKEQRLYTKNHINMTYSEDGLKNKGIIINDEINIYHCGHVKNEKNMAMKMAYYLKRDKKKKETLTRLSELVIKNSNWFDSRIKDGINPNPKDILVYKGKYPNVLLEHPRFNNPRIKNDL